MSHELADLLRKDAFSATPNYCMLSILEREGIPLIDLVPTFAATQDPSALYAFGDRDSAYYGTEVYRLVADAVMTATTGAQ